MSYRNAKRHARTAGAIQAAAVAALILAICSPALAQHIETTALSPDQERVLRLIAKGQSAPWPEMTAPQAAYMHGKAETMLARYRENHLPFGLGIDVRWSGYDRSEVVSHEGLGDSAIWSGHYLAALALRYHVQPDEDTRSAMLNLLKMFDLLSRVTARPGAFARYVGPEDSKPYRRYYERYGGQDPQRPGFGRRAFAGEGPYEGLVWLGRSSRDAYTGIALGLAAAWAFVDDPEVRERVRFLVRRTGDAMVRDLFWIRDGRGARIRPTTWYGLAWARLLLSVDPERFGHIGFNYQRRARRAAAHGLYVRPMAGRGDYYANNLNFARLFILCVLEDNPLLRARLIEALKQFQADSLHHLNPHWSAIYAFCTGDTANNDVRAIVQGMLLDYPDQTWDRVVDHRNDPAIPAQNEDYTLYALLARERPPRDFYWQRRPVVRHGGSLRIIEFAQIDVFLPYWMARAANIMRPH